MGWLDKLLGNKAAPPILAEAPPTQRPVPVVVDHRERAGGMVDALAAALPAADLEVAQLEIGDVVVAGVVGVERKRTDDFCASLRDGRLFDQAARLSRAYRSTALLLEGDFTREAAGAMGGAALRGAIVSLELEWRIPILRTRDVEDSARYIVAIAERMRARGIAARQDARPRREAPAQAASPVLAVLVNIPGVGIAKAEAVAERFPTLPALLSADSSALAEVPGIGRELAARIAASLAAK
ncbi:MAG: ERCC4 domain-containing protein [Candidatus Sumerlaeia bacterium]|nr:ERCC4 domain-containing protein [Candidatus Sumerlaeia bacterium]